MAGLQLACQVGCESGAAFKPMQRLKRAQACASIGGNVCHAHFLPGACTLGTLCHVVSQAQFPRTEEQQAPGQTGTRGAVAGGAGLALLIGQHVGAFARYLALYLRQLVKDQQRIAVLRRDGLQRVIRGAPALHVAGPAVHAGSHAQGRGLAAGTVAPQVKAPALHARRAQQRPGKGAGHGKHQAAVARAQRPHTLTPRGCIALGAKGVLHGRIALEHDALCLVSDGFMGQHEGGAVPAYAVCAGGELVRAPGLYVFGQPVAGRWRSGNAQAHVQQRGAVFAAVAAEHAGRHGPLLGPAQGVGKVQQVAPAVALGIAGQCLHIQAAAQPQRRQGFAVAAKAAEEHPFIGHAESVVHSCASIWRFIGPGRATGGALARLLGCGWGLGLVGIDSGLHGLRNSLQALRLVLVIEVEVLRLATGRGTRGEHRHPAHGLRRSKGFFSTGVAACAGLGGAVIIASQHDQGAGVALAQGLGNVRQVARIKRHGCRVPRGLVHAGAGGVPLAHHQHSSASRITAPVPQARLAPTLEKLLFRASLGALGLYGLQVPQHAVCIAQGHHQAARRHAAHTVGAHALAGQVGHLQWVCHGLAGIPLGLGLRGCASLCSLPGLFLGLLALLALECLRCQGCGVWCCRGLAALGQHKAVLLCQV